jgi:uroporphyrinogen-III synthase
LTHALPRVEKLVSELTALGIEAVAAGLQKIVVTDLHRAQTSAARQQLSWFDTVVFVSPNAVDVFFDQPLLGPLPSKLYWLCVGQATAQALRQQLPVSSQGSIICGTSNDADAVLVLLNSLRAQFRAEASAQATGTNDSNALKVLVVRGTSGREDWIQTCKEFGDQVAVLAAYTSSEQVPDLNVTQQLTARRKAQKQGSNSPVVFVVASTQLAGQLFQWLSSQSPELADWALSQTTLAIHPRIVDRLVSFGFVAPKLISPGVQGIVDGLK